MNVFWIHRSALGLLYFGPGAPAAPHRMIAAAAAIVSATATTPIAVAAAKIERGDATAWRACTAPGRGHRDRLLSAQAGRGLCNARMADR
ncbi:hypothetical protein [Bradyrhizobium sp. USDA 4454]